MGLWSYSITQAKFSIGYYGLLNSFPVTFYVALGILTVASAVLWVSKENHSKLLLLQLCLLIISLWLIPIAIGGTDVGFYHGNVMYGYIEYLTREGQIPLQVTDILFHFQWPAASLWGAGIVEILGIKNPDILVVGSPIGWMFLLLPILYVFFKNTLGKGNYCWAALWVFYLARWVGEYQMSPQAVSYFLFMVILVLLSKTLVSRHIINTSALRLSIILTFSGLIITHLLTSLFGLVTTTVFFAARRINASTLIILFGVGIAAWAIYQVSFTLEQKLPFFAERVFRLDMLWQTNVLGRVLRGTQAHQTVALIRVLFTGMFIAMAFIGGILGRRLNKGNKSADIAVFAIGAGIIAMMVVFAGVYGKEFMFRINIFLLPVLAYFSVKLLHFKITSFIFCGLLIIGIPLHIISTYGNQQMDYFPPGSAAALDFFHANTAEGYTTGGRPIGASRNRERYREIIYSNLHWEDGLLVYNINNEVPGGMPHYVAISPQDRGEYELLHDDALFVPETEARLNNSGNYNLIYINPVFSLYVREEE